MKSKTSIQERIRGWFPTTPNLPQHHNEIPKLQPLKTFANPLPPMLESRFQRWAGIFIGFGIGMMALGFGAALLSNLTYNEVARFFSTPTDNYLFREMLDRTSFFLALGVGGVFATGLGALSLRSEMFRRVTVEKGKHFWSNYLFGLGFGLIVISFRFLFLFLLAPNDPILNHGYIQLELFAGTLLVGAAMFTGAIVSWRRRR